MDVLSRKLTAVIKENAKGSKKIVKADPATTDFFERAKSLFPLHERAEEATGRDWEVYTTNRLTAEKQFPGPKEKKTAGGEGEKEGGDDEEELEDEDEDEEYSDKFCLGLIRDCMVELEKEMELALSNSFRVLRCDSLFEQENAPRTATLLTRIYSSIRPVYIDVHFQYHSRSCHDCVEWYYCLGFKIYNRPGTNDYHPSEVKKFENGRFDRAYSGNDWRPIAYGFYDECDDYREEWVRVENARFALGEDDVKDLYEALWGPLDDGRGNAQEEEERDRRCKMVDTVRVLLAAVGIDYFIAIDDDEQDDPRDVYKLEGLSDRWFARGTRKACGFQLTKDPENEKKGLAERDDEMNTDEEEEWDSDDESYD